jgi:predicted anti-sigma-YlaC factor YlaD
MSACKSYERQIALLSVQALSEKESAAVLDHLRECAACRAYAGQLEGVVSLYMQDAERPIAPTSLAAARFEVERVPWFNLLFASPRPVIVAMVALGVSVLLISNRPGRDRSRRVQAVAHIVPGSVSAVPTIGNSRHLTSAEFEQLTEVQPPQTSRDTEFVFSVRTRDEGF